MKQLNCKSCGAAIDIEDNKNFGKCPYCGAKYKLNEDINVNINIDEEIKDIVKNGSKVVSKTLKSSSVIFLLIFVLSLTIFIVVSFKQYNTMDKINDDFNDKTEEQVSSAELSSFNGVLEMYSGTQSKFFIETALDTVVTKNKKNADKLITVVYNEKSTTTPSEIVEIKHSLDSNYKYEISYDYDSLGFINKMTIEMLNN